MESTESPCVPENPVPESEIKESESLFLVNCIQLVYFLFKKKKNPATDTEFERSGIYHNPAILMASLTELIVQIHYWLQ